MKRYKFILLFVVMPSVVLSANHYVRAGASGNNSGTDWVNAYTSLPATLVRGDTYYIADGSYSGYTFDDPASGSSVITIIKATPNNHGTDTGWSNAYGDGQAAWGPLNFNSSYWVFDGQKGFGTGSQESYGFKVSYKGSDKGIKLVRFNNFPFYITLRHVDLEHAGAFGDNGHDIIYSPAGRYYTLSYCYLHDVGKWPIYIENTSDSIIEYCYVARNESTPAEHSEAIFALNGADRNVVRYCVFEDIEGTGCIMLSGDSWEIYGNVIFWTPGFNRRTYGNGAIGTWTQAPFFSTNVKIYNNVFANLADATNGGLNLKSGNNIAYNNLWYNCARPRLYGAAHDYNSFFACADNSELSGEAHAQIEAGNPFVELAQKNFRLTAGTAPGLKLSAVYEKDADGKIRGADGTWDRGAFEFNGSAGGNLAPIPNAGPDQFIQVGIKVTLDASASSDPNGDALVYLWAQTSGPSVSLSNTTQAVVSFVPVTVGTYAFRVTVNDGQLSTTDEVRVVAQEQPVPIDNLLAYWKVDESSGMIAMDFAGSHNATLINGPVWRPASGQIGGALEFDGVDDYVDIGTLDITGGTGLTLALWFKADDFDAGYARFIAKVTETQDHYWLLSTSDDGTALRFNLKAGGSTSVLRTSTGQIQTGRWYHVAATYDGSRMLLYKNGVEIASINKSGSIDTNPNVLATIGNQPPAAGSWPFDGLIDDVRIYNRALSATEIAAIANPITTGLSENSPQALPTQYELNQNTPNPFNPSTTISFSLPKPGFVVLTVYTLLGHQIANLVNAKLPAGKHSVLWLPEGLPTGMYYYRIVSNGFVQTKKMLLTK